MSSTPNGQASAGVIDPVDTRKGGLPLLMAVLLAAAVAFQLNASMLHRCPARAPWWSALVRA